LRGADAGQHVGATHMAMQQQQYLHERSGAAGITGLALQDLQIVIQIKDFGALAHRALMACCNEEYRHLCSAPTDALSQYDIELWVAHVVDRVAVGGR
jgi:hypothetical protein